MTRPDAPAQPAPADAPPKSDAVDVPLSPLALAAIAGVLGVVLAAVPMWNGRPIDVAVAAVLLAAFPILVARLAGATAGYLTLGLCFAGGLVLALVLGGLDLSSGLALLLAGATSAGGVLLMDRAAADAQPAGDPDQLDEARLTSEGLRQQLRQSRDRADVAEQQVAEAQQVAAASEKKAEQLDRRLAAAALRLREAEQGRTETAATAAELDSLRANLAEAKQERDAFAAKLQDAAKVQAERDEAAAALAAEREEAQRTLATLRRERTERDELAAKLQAAPDTAAIERERDELAAQLLTVSRQLADAKQAASAAWDDDPLGDQPAEDVTALLAERDALRRQVDELEDADAEDADAAAVAISRAETAERELEASRETVDKLAAQLNQEAELSRDLVKRAEAVEAKLAGLEAAEPVPDPAVARLTRERDEARRTRSVLMTSLDKAAAERDDATARAQAAEQAAARATRQAEDSIAKQAELLAELATLGTRLTTVEQQAKLATEQVTALTPDAQAAPELREQLAATEAQRATLQAAAEQAARHAADLDARVADLGDKLTATEQQVQNAQAAAATAERQAAEATAAAAFARTEAELATQEAARTQAAAQRVAAFDPPLTSRSDALAAGIQASGGTTAVVMRDHSTDVLLEADDRGRHFATVAIARAKEAGRPGVYTDLAAIREGRPPLAAAAVPMGDEVFAAAGPAGEFDDAAPLLLTKAADAARFADARDAAARERQQTQAAEQRADAAERRAETALLEATEAGPAAAYELRPTLRALRQYADLLARDGGDAKTLDRLRTEAVRAEARLDAWLDASEEAAPPEAVAIADVAALSLADLEAALDAAGAEVVTDHLPRDVRVAADAAGLRRALAHLLQNALDFARPGHPPRIELFATTTGDRATIGVRDNGIGIAEQHHDEVFRPLRRLNRHGRGTGMGLALVQRFARHQGGHAHLTSTPGQGTTIWLELPLAP